MAGKSLTPPGSGRLAPRTRHDVSRPSKGLTVLGVDKPDSLNLGRLVEPHYGVTNRMKKDTELHTVVFGANGKGKGTRLLMPNLLQMSGSSIVVVDPKGELAAVTAEYRRTLGRVVIINPFGVLVDHPGYEDLKSEGYNPLARLDPSSPKFNSETSLLAQALVWVSSNDGGNSKYFSGSARALCSAIIMQTVIEARAAGKVPTMARVRELLCQPSMEGNDRLGMEAIGLPALAEEMYKSPIVGLRNKAAQFTEWNKETGGIARTAMIETEFFDDDPIIDDMSKGTFDFGDLKREPMTVYLILPPEMMERHAKWLRMVLTGAIQSVMRPRKSGEPRVLFMLDEFFALGHLEIIANVWALVRGYGISIMPILQDLGQLKELYPKNWETFIGNAGVTVSFCPNDMTTAEWLSRRAGDTTRELVTINRSKSTTSGTSGGSSTGGQGSTSSGWNHSVTFNESENNSPVKVPLIEPHALLGLQKGFTLMTISGLPNVVPAYIPAYYELNVCKERARKNPYRIEE